MLRKIFFLLLSLPSMQVYAQQESGDVELGVQGFFSTTIDTDSPTASGNIMGKIGLYLSDHIELGFGPSISITSSPVQRRVSSGSTYVIKTGTEVSSDFGTSAFLAYSFLTRTVTVPYFGVQYYKMSFNDSNDKGSVGVNGGIKFFFSRRAAFDLSGNYLFSLNEGQDTKLFTFAFGVSVLF